MKKFLLAAGLLFCCASVSNAQAEYPDVPIGDSAYTDINLLLQSGVIEYGHDGGRSYRAMTRYEFAVAIARLLDINSEIKDANGKFSTANDPATTYSSEVAATLKRLATKFLPELNALGIDTEKIKINGVFLIEPKTTQPQTKVAPPFSDVPKNHWAFESVEKLRLSGIVIGSPN